MSNDEFGNYFPTSKVIAFLKSYDDKQMWDYMFQLILYSQAQFSNSIRQGETNKDKGSFGQASTGISGGVTSTTTPEWASHFLVFPFAPSRALPSSLLVPPALRRLSLTLRTTEASSVSRLNYLPPYL